MSCTGYTPLTKTVILPAVGNRPPINGTVKIHIKQMLTDGTVLSDSLNNHPLGHEIDLTNTHVLSSLIDELMTMVPGEVSQYLCKQEDMVSGLFSVDLPPNQDLIIEVEMLDWYGQDVSPDQDKSMRKSIVEEGTSRGTPCWTGKCTLSLEYEDSPAKEVLCRLGDGASYGVPYPVEVCALTMHRNETCKLETPDRTYTLKLLALEKEKCLYKMGVEEVLKCAEDLKVRGNNAYKVNKLRLAQLYYQRCIVYVESIVKSEQDHATTNLLHACRLNLALVYLKLEEFPKAITYCTTVLWTQPKSAKALYRRAVAYDKQCFHDEAINDLMAILRFDTDNKEAKSLLSTVRSNKQNKSIQEKNQMKTVFLKIEEEYKKSSSDEPPPKSVWEDAEESCPPELATEDAYAVYKGTLEEEEKRLKAEAAARQAEYEAANPPKKKKKRKKKKKPVTSEVVIAETEEIKVDEKKEEEKEPEPDAGMTYHVSAEKTFVTKTEDPGFANAVNNHSATNENDQLKKHIDGTMYSAGTKLEEVKLEEVKHPVNGAEAAS